MRANPLDDALERLTRYADVLESDVPHANITHQINDILGIVDCAVVAGQHE